jgi:hypothetical protein
MSDPTARRRQWSYSGLANSDGLLLTSLDRGLILRKGLRRFDFLQEVVENSVELGTRHC